MTVYELLAEVRRRGVALRADGGRLLAKPLRALPPELREELARRKHEVLALLRAAPARPCRCCGGRDWWLGPGGAWVCGACHPPASEPLARAEAREPWDEALAERLLRETLRRCAEVYDPAGPPWPKLPDLEPFDRTINEAWEQQDMAALRRALADYEAAVREAVEQRLRGEVA